MWTEQQRQILCLEVSGKKIRLDPMPVLRRYRDATKRVGSETFSEAVKEVLSGNDTQPLISLVMPVIRETFNWKSFDEDNENGYTESEMLIAFTQFIEWMVESKKKDENLPSSAGQAGDSGEIPVTPNTAESSSAVASSNHDAPGLMQSASV